MLLSKWRSLLCHRFAACSSFLCWIAVHIACCCQISIGTVLASVHLCCQSAIFSCAIWCVRCGLVTCSPTSKHQREGFCVYTRHHSMTVGDIARVPTFALKMHGLWTASAVQIVLSNSLQSVQDNNKCNQATVANKRAWGQTPPSKQWSRHAACVTMTRGRLRHIPDCLQDNACNAMAASYPAPISTLLMQGAVLIASGNLHMVDEKKCHLGPDDMTKWMKRKVYSDDHSK